MSRFGDFEVENFIQKNENQTTLRKTLGHMKLLSEFLLSKGENRELSFIPKKELDPLLASFFVNVKTKDGEDYEPSSLRVSGTAGPMARDLDGLVQMMRAILCDYHFELDPYIPPIPFRDEIFESKRQLRVGFYVNDGYIPVVPACGRAVMMAKRALEQQGHTVCL